jgi:Uncharacterized protein conserved in bacteria
VFGGNKSVIRGGYSRVYGRLNGVDLVLVPLLGTGLIQAVQCRQNFMPVGGAAPACGPTNPTAANAFRVGTDGNNAPIPAARQRFRSPPSRALTASQRAREKPSTRVFVLTSSILSISPSSGN